MTVFKTFLKVLNKCKVPVLFYTVILIFFGALNMQTSETGINFAESKPKIVIINKDEDEGIITSFIHYIEENAELVEMEEEQIEDAVFYRDISYVVTIPKNYRQDFLKGKNPSLMIKKSGDYNSSLADMIVKRYLEVVDIYQKTNISEEELVSNVNEILKMSSSVEVTSTLDTNSLAKLTFYYNFMNYSILAGTIYVICLVLYSFHEQKIARRTIISSMNYQKHNRILLGGNLLFSFCLWAFYVILSIILFGNVALSGHGIIYIINSFIFMIFAVTLAFLISNMMHNKDALNGLINVLALGSSFLCGAFVPVNMLPSFVLNIAHILPSYWYINTNERLSTLEVINFETLKPIIINMIVVFAFALLCIVLSNKIGKQKRKS